FGFALVVICQQVSAIIVDVQFLFSAAGVIERSVTLFHVVRAYPPINQHGNGMCAAAIDITHQRLRRFSFRLVVIKIRTVGGWLLCCRFLSFLLKLLQWNGGQTNRLPALDIAVRLRMKHVTLFNLLTQVLVVYFSARPTTATGVTGHSVSCRECSANRHCYCCSVGANWLRTLALTSSRTVRVPVRLSCENVTDFRVNEMPFITSIGEL